jgi:Tfp pilus assembly protein PilO
MAILLMLLLLVVVAVLGYLVYQSSEEPQPPIPLDPEVELKTALRLHEIGRNFDVADLKHQQRQDAIRLRHEIRETLKDMDK